MHTLLLNFIIMGEEINNPKQYTFLKFTHPHSRTYTNLTLVPYITEVCLGLEPLHYNLYQYDYFIYIFTSMSIFHDNNSFK